MRGLAGHLGVVEPRVGPRAPVVADHPCDRPVAGTKPMRAAARDRRIAQAVAAVFETRVFALSHESFALSNDEVRLT